MSALGFVAGQVEGEAFANAMLETVGLPLLALDSELRVEVVNDAFLRHFDVSREETLHRFLYELGNRQWDIPDLRRLLVEIIPRVSLVTDYRIEHTFERIGRRVMRLNAKRVERLNARDAILLAISDETTREKLQLDLEGRIEFADKLLDSVREALLILRKDLSIQSANQPFYDVFKVSKAETEGRLVYELGNGQWNIPELRLLLEEILPHTRSFDDYEVRHRFEAIGERVMRLNGRRLDHTNMIVLAIRDITSQIETEKARFLRERRQAFLLKLADALRPLSDPTVIQAEAARILGEELGVARTAYYEIEGDDYIVAPNYTFGVPPLIGRYPTAAFGQNLLDRQHQGAPIIVPDTARAHTPNEVARLAQLQIGAYVNVPFVKEARFVAGLTVHSQHPRDWAAAEVRLVEEVAERTWAAVERARAEKKLRAAHDTFRQLIDRSPFGIYVVDGAFRLVQVSEGARRVFENVSPLIGRDMADVMSIIWPAPFACEAVARFRQTLATGEPYHASTVERRADTSLLEAYDWRIERITLPDGRPGVVCHFYDWSERQRYEEHIRLLMREVNHRSKNLLSLIQAIARRTAATSPDEFLARFSERLESLSAGQDLLVKNDWKAVPLADLVQSQLSHFADLVGTRVICSGPPVSLTSQATQAIGMALHELATNAAKYGALSNKHGCVDILWRIEAGVGSDALTLQWTESGGPPVKSPKRGGFGTSVVSAAVEASTGGRVTLDYAPAGLTWRMTADTRSIVDGGFTTSRGAVGPQSDTQGGASRVLVVEDEPILAADMAEILREVGLEVLGPVGEVSHALAFIDRYGCDAAVLDVNLQNGDSVPVAQKLISLKKPFVVVTGYSTGQLPTSLRNAPTLTKPIGRSALQVEVERCLGESGRSERSGSAPRR